MPETIILLLLIGITGVLGVVLGALMTFLAKRNV